MGTVLRKPDPNHFDNADHIEFHDIAYILSVCRWTGYVRLREDYVRTNPPFL